MPSHDLLPGGHAADGGELIREGRVAFHNAHEGDACLVQPSGELCQRGLVSGDETDRVRTRWNVRPGAFACGMDQLGGLEPAR